MTNEQQALLDRARRTLATATSVLELGDPESAINRAYYAAHYAARAALLTKGEAPKTHSGVLSRFYLHFVTTGVLPERTGAILGNAFDLRQRADYDTFASFDALAAADLITDVERFVAAVRALLGEDLHG